MPAGSNFLQADSRFFFFLREIFFLTLDNLFRRIFLVYTIQVVTSLKNDQRDEDHVKRKLSIRGIL